MSAKSARRRPSVNVRIDAMSRLPDFRNDDVDIGVRYAGGDYPHFHVHRLLDEEMFLACGPALSRGVTPLTSPADLRHHTLLHVDRMAQNSSWIALRAAIESHGV